MPTPKSLTPLERQYKKWSCQHCPVAKSCMMDVDDASRVQFNDNQWKQLKAGSFRPCSERVRLNGSYGFVSHKVELGGII